MEELCVIQDQLKQLELCEKLGENNSAISKREASLYKCQIYLTLRLYRKALLCSESILEEDPYEFKAQTFKVRSLFAQGKYQESLIFLTKTIKFLEEPKNAKRAQQTRHMKTLKNYIKEAEHLSEQEKSGRYEMSHFVPNRKVRYENIAEFKGPIDIGTTIPGKGRGILAKEDIHPGQLLLASKAFEIVFDDCDDKWTLERAIAQKLTLDRSLCGEVYQLYAGNDLGYIPYSGGELTPRELGSVDMERITGICSMNSFGNSKNTTGYGHDSRGLWILPSFVNHDCIDFNCIWKCLGDFIFIRALKPIRQGEELLICYTDSAEPLQERVKFFQAHDFICQCRLCKHQMEEAPQSRQRQMEILEKVEGLSISSRGQQDNTQEDIIEYLEKGLKELETMGIESGKPEWNFSTHILLDNLCKLYIEIGNIEKQKEVAEKYYKVVNGSGNTEVSEGSKVCLEVGAAGQVASVFIKCGDLNGATKWIDILKKDLSLVYGKADVFKLLYPVLHAQAMKNGINC